MYKTNTEREFGEGYGKIQVRLRGMKVTFWRKFSADLDEISQMFQENVNEILKNV